MEVYQHEGWNIIIIYKMFINLNSVTGVMGKVELNNYPQTNIELKVDRQIA